MPIQVYKVAYIFGKKILLSTVSISSIKIADVAAILLNLDEVKDYDEECKWILEFTLGKNEAARLMCVELPPFINKANYELSKREPIFIRKDASHSVNSQKSLVFFKNQFFMPQRMNKPEEHEEIVLRVKKIVYREEAELIKLREEIQNIEMALEYRASNIKRTPISDDIKSLVWARDQGHCLNCGSTTALHFDHIIPVSKGGSNHHENLQILCQTCNLKKSDKITPGV